MLGENIKSLFSIIIVSYNNYKYIYDAIDSVLQQTYPNIEIIISNDASGDFLQEEIETYIENNKKDNIVRVVINNNEENIGTVRNVNKAIGMSNGELIFLMAADDGLYDETVLNEFAEYFNKLGDRAQVITAQTAMCGESLGMIEYLALDATLVDIIKTYTPNDMFKHLSHTYTIPATSTCYRRSFYEIVGLYDEDYYLIEDAPQFIRMSRMGIRAYYLDIIAARHRDGGISHGNKSNTGDAFAQYCRDEIKFYEKEVFPYADILGKKIINHVKEKHYLVSKSYIYKFEWRHYSFTQKTLFFIKNIRYLFKKILRPTIDKIVQFSFNLEKMKNFLLIGMMMFLFSIIVCRVEVNNNMRVILFWISKYVGIFGIISFLSLLGINILYRIYIVLKKGFQMLNEGK